MAYSIFPCAESLPDFGTFNLWNKIMKTLLLTIFLVLIFGPHNAVFADDDDYRRYQKYWQADEWKEEFWDGPCEVKIESKHGEFKREIKCKDGIGARWSGEWKKEFQDGPCRVKQEAKRDEFKEEVKCERHD